MDLKKDHFEVSQTTTPTFSEDSAYNSKLIIDSKEFSIVAQKLRNFFLQKGFIESHPQNRLSILAACEDPFNVSTFNYSCNCWPLPQTGQMWLEYELLKDPTPPGFFCLSTSYRQEKNPVDDRHDLIFPLFEFEMKGDMQDLIQLEMELLKFLGYNPFNFIQNTKQYETVSKEYNVKELEHEHETQLYNDYGPAFFLTDFPEYTDPFWNMKRDTTNNTAKKVDVILSGQETIGSAERETDPDIMLTRFNTICDGKYKDKMFELFGEKRTMKEMKDYLSFNFFKRSGGGIGMTRLIRSMKKEKLL